MTRQMLLMLALFASFECLGEDSPRTTKDVRELAAGTWGFEVEGASCSDNPHTLAFSDVGRTMTMQYSVGLDGNAPTKATYTVLATGVDFIRMRKVDESEKTESGETVVWELLILSEDSYCWHRTDWQPGGCTQPASRCKP